MEQLGYLSIGMLVSYLVGAIPFGLFLAKIKGIDILNQGSGNIGATNVGRVLGAKYGLAVFVLDALKGALPAKAGMLYLDTPLGPEIAGILTGASAIFGHLFPIYLKFKGGKGIASLFGVLLGATPALGLLTGIIWILIFKLYKISSLASLTSMSVMALLSFFYDDFVNYTYLIVFIIICIKHKDNIVRLFNNTEKTIK
jgi:glycerol-3-phosphate acyltransferase PlsY